MATLAIDNDELKENIALALGLGRDPSGDWDSQITSDVNRCIRAGRRKFFLANNWAFLESEYAIVTELPVEFTAACVNGVVTRTAGDAIPSSPVGNYKLSPGTDGGLYDVAEDTTGANVITLVDTSLDFDSQTVTMYRYRYALPSNFGSFVDPVIVENSVRGDQLREYATLPDFQFTGIANRNELVTGPPELFALTHDVDGETGNFDVYLNLYPLPDDAQYVIKTTIRIEPGDSLEEVGSVMHPIFSETLQQACLASAEIMFSRAPGVHSALFGELLPAAIKKDREMRGTRRLLPRDTKEFRRDNSEIRRAEIDLSGALLP